MLKRLLAGLLDHAAMTGTSAILSILLGRWLVPDEFAIFAYLVALLAFGVSLHSAAVLEYLSIASGRGVLAIAFGGRIVSSHFTWVLIAIVATLTFHCLKGFDSAIAIQSIALVVAVPAALSFALVRRLMHLQQDYRSLCAAVGTYLLAFVLAIAITADRSFVNSTVGFSIISLSCIAGLVAASGFLNRVKHELAGTAVVEGRSARKRYVRWAVAAAVSGWFPVNGYFVLLPLLSDELSESARLRALLTVVLPFVQVSLAIGVAALPVLSQVGARKGSFRAHEARTYWNTLFALIALGASVVWVAGDSLIDWLFAGRYATTALDIWLLGMVLGSMTCMTGLAHMLRAQDRSRLVLVAYLVATIVAAVGIWPTTTLGATAALGAIGMGYMFGAALLYIFLRNYPHYR